MEIVRDQLRLAFRRQHAGCPAAGRVGRTRRKLNLEMYTTKGEKRSMNTASLNINRPPVNQEINDTVQAVPA